tara:strand:- start:250 stop:438 length:189 start_codon:yes stop_codon:yes gene_type:complete
MRSVKITDLPNGPWREYALEAQRRGLEKISDCRLSGTDVMLIGAIDLIRELTEKITKLETKS